MFRDRVVSMEQTLEGGEKNLEFLKAICREALPEFEYREHFLEHERDLFVMLLEAPDGRKKKVGWTRMVLFDAERLPALVENPVSPLRSRILAYLQARVARPEIVVTFRHLEDGWVDTPEPRREKRRGRRGGRDGRGRGAAAAGTAGQGQAQGGRGAAQRDRDRKPGRGGGGALGGGGGSGVGAGAGKPEGGRERERQRQRQRGSAPQQGPLRRDGRDASPGGAAASGAPIPAEMAGMAPGGESGAEGARPGGGGGGRRRRFRRRRRGRGGSGAPGGSGGAGGGPGAPGGSGGGAANA
jgi:hypothetical protein